MGGWSAKATAISSKHGRSEKMAAYNAMEEVEDFDEEFWQPRLVCVVHRPLHDGSQTRAHQAEEEPLRLTACACVEHSRFTSGSTRHARSRGCECVYVCARVYLCIPVHARAYLVIARRAKHSRVFSENEKMLWNRAVRACAEACVERSETPSTAKRSFALTFSQHVW